MTIAKKLLIGFGGTLGLSLLVSGVGLVNLSRLKEIIDLLVSVEAKKHALASEMNTLTSDLIASERAILVRSFMKDSMTGAKYQEDFQEALGRLRQDMDEFSALVETAEGRSALDELRSSTTRVTQAHDEVYRLASSGQADAAAAAFMQTAFPAMMQGKESAQRLMAAQTRVAGAHATSAHDVLGSSRWITVLVLALSFIIGAAITVGVRSIHRELPEAVEALREGATQTASAASQVSSSSQSLAQGASEQAASLEETAASSTEINSMARKNTESSRVAAELVTHSGDRFVQANQSLQEMVVAMDEITASSDKISRIIKVVDEISFQTNILALNAAVEAARADEAGMGFAIVADEVRNLAQRCAQAARDTAGLIEESIAKSGEGKQKVDQVAIAIRAITAESDKVKTLVNEMHLGSQEQARGIDQIGKAIVQMERVTQTTAANAEQSAAAAEELTAQSEGVRKILAQLTMMVDGRQEEDRLVRTVGRKTAVQVDKRRTPVNVDTAMAGFPLEQDLRDL